VEFLAITRRRLERFPEAEFAAILDEEAETVRTLYAEGLVRAVNGRGDRPGAVLRLEAPSAAEAEAAVARLPLARRQMMDVEIVPLLPYRGFAPRGGSGAHPAPGRFPHNTSHT